MAAPSSTPPPSPTPIPFAVAHLYSHPQAGASASLVMSSPVRDATPYAIAYLNSHSDDPTALPTPRATPFAVGYVYYLQPGATAAAHLPAPGAAPFAIGSLYLPPRHHRPAPDAMPSDIDHPGATFLALDATPSAIGHPGATVPALDATPSAIGHPGATIPVPAPDATPFAIGYTGATAPTTDLSPMQVDQTGSPSPPRSPLPVISFNTLAEIQEELATASGPFQVQIGTIDSIGVAPEFLQLLALKMMEDDWECDQLLSLKRLSRLANMLEELLAHLLPRLIDDPGDASALRKVLRRARRIIKLVEYLRTLGLEKLCSRLGNRLKRLTERVIFGKKPATYLTDKLDEMVSSVDEALGTPVEFPL